MNVLLLAPELLTTDSGIPRILRLYLKALCELGAKLRRAEKRFLELESEIAAAQQSWERTVDIAKPIPWIFRTGLLAHYETDREWTAAEVMELENIIGDELLDIGREFLAERGLLKDVIQGA